MTRDEAIAVLQEEMDGNLELTLREWIERDEQRLFPALRMAIEALTHEIRTETHGVCLISRADAIEAVAKLQKYDLDERNRLRIYAPWHNPKRIFVETEAIYKTIYTLPSADAEWIPCDTSGMPPEGEEVLVSDGKYIWIDETVAGDATEDGYMMWWGNGSDWIGTAWMPLPKPYKGE